MLIRYYFDEHIFGTAVIELRRHGVDVMTTAEAGNIEKTDLDQLLFAAKEGRVLVTRDNDFLLLHSQGAKHAGIVRWHSKRQSRSELVKRLLALWRLHSAEEMLGRVEYF